MIEQRKTLKNWIKQTAGAPPLIFHHGDTDGSCAAAIMHRLLNDEGIEPEKVQIPPHRIHEVDANFGKPTIILDMACRSATNPKEVLVVDHHLPKDIPKDIFYINPRVSDPDAYIPAAKVMFDLRGNEKDDWIAAMGTIQDFAVEPNRRFMESVQEHHPDLLPRTMTQKNAFKSPLGKLSTIINVKPFHDAMKWGKTIHAILMNSTHPEEMKEQPGWLQLEDRHNQINEEITYWIDRGLEQKKDVIILEIESRWMVGSAIATGLSANRSNTTVIIVTRLGEKVHLSLRNQSGNINTVNWFNALISEELKEKVRAGGHPKASGTSFHYSLWPAVKECLDRHTSKK